MFLRKQKTLLGFSPPIGVKARLDKCTASAFFNGSDGPFGYTVSLRTVRGASVMKEFEILTCLGEFTRTISVNMAGSLVRS